MNLYAAKYNWIFSAGRIYLSLYHLGPHPADLRSFHDSKFHCFTIYGTSSTGNGIQDPTMKCMCSTTCHVSGPT